MPIATAPASRIPLMPAIFRRPQLPAFLQPFQALRDDADEFPSVVVLDLGLIPLPLFPFVHGPLVAIETQVCERGVRAARGWLDGRRVGGLLVGGNTLEVELELRQGLMVSRGCEG